MNKKRPNKVTFRLTDDELASLKKKISSSGQKQQEYLLRSALDKEITNTDGIKEIIPEMKAQGNNLNQIAKRLNERGYVDYDNTLAATLKEVQAVWESLKQYLRGHR